jgi:Enolase C-terminal domain-like
MAETHYAQLALHMYSGPVEALASIHVAACCPNFLITEGIGRWVGFYNEILVKPFRWEDGYIIPPDEPGLGIELREDVLRTHAYPAATPRSTSRIRASQRTIRAAEPRHFGRNGPSVGRGRRHAHSRSRRFRLGHRLLTNRESHFVIHEM